VYGDIGTSPLYAFREGLAQAGETVRPEAALGVVSLALWALIVVVTVKYIFFLMRADNGGEGGVLSLAALAEKAVGRRTPLIFALGITGAALFYGDAVITPAISVLSAVEGLRSAPMLRDVVTPGVVIGLSVAILAPLFLMQSHGTAGVARFFGPVCILWFLVIGGLGAGQVLRAPEVLAAFDPRHGAMFLVHHGWGGLLVLGAVFLTVTGAEALYADMGHFGRWPIQACWLFFVLPALALNYLGQGALVLWTLEKAGGVAVASADWFFLMAPEGLRIPLVLLAAAATVIASQAVITGAFSLTSQAMQMGLLPRMSVKRTSETEAGQIYLPQINLLLAGGVLLLIGVFHTSSAMAHAYGLAVTGTMVVTTTLAFIVVRRGWAWPLAAAVGLIGPLLAIDLVFLGANAMKLLSGGFVPVVLGGVLILLMTAWVRGSHALARKVADEAPLLADIALRLDQTSAYRAPGTAVFLTSDPDHVPAALLHNLKHNKVLHLRNLIVCVRTASAPYVADAARADVSPVSEGFTRIILTFGYMETPNVPRALAMLRKQGVTFDIMATSFFLGRRSVVRGLHSRLPRPLGRLFIWMTRNAADPTDVFRIPAGRVVELGAQVSL
jgi:KUP system potassium uptake protein